jgi:uncharacterized protein
LKIDIFTHIIPAKYKEALNRKSKMIFQDELNAKASALCDLDYRFRIMDSVEGLKQVLTIVQPPIESMVEKNDAVELAQIANDGMAELIVKYPDRFAGAAACLPLNNMDAALKEAERAIKKLGFKGVQIYTPINGKPLDNPEFMGLYAMMSDFDLPIWLHPTRDQSVPDYVGENESKYDLYASLGWPYETSMGMARLVYGGVFDKYPNLKIITHHCGAMVSFFARRLWEFPRPWLKKPVIEYFKMFYHDTALMGNVPALACGHTFFGTSHILFGTDGPFGGQENLENDLKAVEALHLTSADQEKIFSGNARMLLKLL